jgi:hypothetical protein
MDQLIAIRIGSIFPAKSGQTGKTSSKFQINHKIKISIKIQSNCCLPSSIVEFVSGNGVMKIQTPMANWNDLSSRSQV